MSSTLKSTATPRTVCCEPVCEKCPNVPYSFFAGPVFGNMNQFVGLGIFVDTYPNADKSHDVSDKRKLLCNDCGIVLSLFLQQTT